MKTFEPQQTEKDGNRMSSPSPEQRASDVLDRWYAAWNAHDLAAISALMTEDVRYEDAGAPRAVVNGRGAVEDYVSALFRGVPDMHLEKLEEWVSLGGSVIASYFRLTATLTGAIDPPGAPAIAPTNGAIEFLGMDRSELREGRLARHQIFYDTAENGRQVGLLPRRGTVTERLTFRLIQHSAAARMRRRR